MITEKSLPACEQHVAPVLADAAQQLEPAIPDVSVDEVRSPSKGLLERRHLGDGHHDL